MCGLVMIVNSTPNAKEKATVVSTAPLKMNALFRDMLLASAVRGTDGTGVFQVGGNYKLYTDKQGMPSGLVVDMKGISPIIADVSNCPITVGHVRAATQGVISKENSHPFQAFRTDGTSVIGAHNGTLYGWDTPRTSYEVDSEWAINEIAEHGVRGIEDMFGAYCFIWYDEADKNKVFIARNSERPFHLARTKDKKSIIGASEAGMIQWLAEKHNVDIDEGVYSVDADSVYSIDFTQEELSVVLESDIAQYNSRSSTTVTAPTPLAPASYADDEGWNHWPYYSEAADSCSLPFTNSRKDSLVKEMKACLQTARWTPLLSDDDEGVDESPVEMGPTNRRPFVAQAKWFSVKGIDGKEVKRAMFENVYGSIIMFDGVEYDNITAEFVGEVVGPIEFKNSLAYVTNSRPDDADKYKGKVRTMVVAGVRQIGDELEYVVVDLNDEGREALAA